MFTVTTSEVEPKVIGTFEDLGIAREFASTCDERRRVTLVVHEHRTVPKSGKEAFKGSQRAIMDRLFGSAVGPDVVLPENSSDARRFDMYEVEEERDEREYGGDLVLTVTAASMSVGKWDPERGPHAGQWGGIKLSGVGSIDALISALQEAKEAIAKESN